MSVVNVGTTPNDGTGDDLRTAFTKINTAFEEVNGAYVLRAVGDDVADDTVALQAFQDAMNASTGLRFVIPKGTYRTTASFSVLGDGVMLDFLDGATINFIGSGSNYFTVSSLDAIQNPAAATNPLTANMAAGSATASVTNTAGYSVGQWVMLFAGLSTNSSGANYIPLYKQAFKIKSIGAGSLTFHQVAEWAFNTADQAYVSAATCRFAVGAVINNPRLKKASGIPYEFGVGGINVTINNLRCEEAGVGFVAVGDNIVFNQPYLAGSASAAWSVARGCGRVVANDPVIHREQTVAGSGAALFIEESPVEVVVNNPSIYGGDITATSSSDTTTNKRLVIRGGRVINPNGRALTVSGWYNADNYGVSMIGTEIDAPGLTNGTNVTLVQANFFNAIEVRDCHFSNYGSAYWLGTGNYGATRIKVSGNTFDGTTPPIEALAGSGAFAPETVAALEFLNDKISALTNVLDYYKEGTWTPVIEGTSSAGAGTYTTQSGSYQRIGNMVTVTARVNWNAHTGSGNIRVSGLPFANGATTRPAVVMSNSLTFSGQLGGLVMASQSYIDLFSIATGAAASAVALDTSAELFIYATYYVA